MRALRSDVIKSALPSSRSRSVQSLLSCYLQGDLVNGGTALMSHRSVNAIVLESANLGMISRRGSAVGTKHGSLSGHFSDLNMMYRRHMHIASSVWISGFRMAGHASTCHAATAMLPLPCCHSHASSCHASTCHAVTAPSCSFMLSPASATAHQCSHLLPLPSQDEFNPLEGESGCLGTALPCSFMAVC